jgi:hypothetical protein
MTNSATFPHILNEIFSDLMKEARIIIDYKGYPCADDDDDDVCDIRIRAVNGYSTPREYNDRVRCLCAQLVFDLMQAQVNFQPVEKSLFMEKALQRFEPLLHVVTFEPLHPKYREVVRGEPACLPLFTYPNFIGDKYHEAPFYLFDRILCQAWKYSYFWDDAITGTHDKLTNLAMMIEFIPPQHQQAQTVQTNNYKAKLLFTGTVPQLACFARVLYENHFFNNTNKSEVCRVFIEMFQTKGKDDIAWKSFKNNFDAPQLDSIRFWQAELSKMTQCFRKLIKMMAA